MSIDYRKMAARVSKAAGGLVHASLHDYKGFGATKKNPSPNLYKVIVSLTDANADKNHISKAIASVFDNLAAPVENSFRKIHNVHGHKYYIGFVATNREVRDYETASVEKMKVMAGNLLLDEGDQSLWEVRSNGDSKYLARHQGDDLEELVCMASMVTDNYTIAQPEFAKLGVTAFQRGEILAYVDAKKMEVKYGFVLADADTGESIEVLNFDEDSAPEKMERVAVDPEMVVESAFIESKNHEWHEEIAAKGEFDPNSMAGQKAFYTQVYGYDKDFLKAFLDMLKDDRSIA